MPKKRPARSKNVFDKVADLQGKQRYIASFVTGVVAVLALPPFHIFPLLLISFPLLLLLIEHAKNTKQAALLGWWFGFGHFLAGLYWISNSLLVDAARFAWLIPFAASLIPSVVALYVALFAVVMYRLKLQGVRRVIAASCLWVMIEFLRAYLFTGFPWNLIGYSWTISTPIIQLASVTGIWGLSLLAMVFALAPLLWADKKTYRQGIVCLLLPIVIAAGGYIRLSQSESRVTETSVRVVQANIKQEMKWEDEYRFKTFMQHVMASNDIHHEAADIIVWPETAVPFVLEKEPFIAKIFREMMPPESTVITGALRTEESQESYRIWNSLYAVSGSGKTEGAYDKVRLVPFGEYVPLRSVLPFVEKITHGSVDFSRGEAAKTIMLPGKPAVAPLICYEVIYPDAIIDPNHRPEWIVNVTNDAWFGNSTGPYQHFSMARLRAVEQGLPLVRAANTGISGVIDAHGNVLSRIPLNHTGVIQTTLPASLPMTFYARVGITPVLMLLSGLFLLVILNKPAKRKK